MVYRHLLNFWPLVPAVDIQAIYEAATSDKGIEHDEDFDVPFSTFQKRHSSTICLPESDRKDNMNILIIGDGIGCLIKTVARMYRHKTDNLNIYIISNFAESLVRDLLLLSLLTDKSPTKGILEKSEIFLEIFGNTLLRESSATFVETESSKILEDISSLRQSVESVPIVSLAYLKQKELDELCNVLRRLKSENFTCNVAKAWENSVRAYFGTRYDNRKNLFDYHFNMRLSHYPVITLKKYLDWCETGIAFTLRKGRYDKPNKTLSIARNANTKASNFFFGDISTSPYISFGVECKNEELFKKVNNQYSYTSEDISKFNVNDFILESISSGVSETMNKVNVYFLFYPTFCKSRRFENFFDAVYITCDMTNWAANGSLSEVVNQNGVVMFETIHNVVNSTKDQKAKHADDINNLAEKNGLKPRESLKCCSDSLKLFVVRD